MRHRISTSNTFISFDPEKYFIFSNGDMSQNIVFYAFDKEYSLGNVKYKTKKKYSRKVLVWLALSAESISIPFIDSTKGPVITADTFISKY